MAEVDRKLKWLHAIVVDQWKFGKSAELRLSCGNGQLKVSLSADFGPAVPSWSAATAVSPGDASGRASPSRLRRRLRREAERASTEKIDARKSAAEEVATEEAVTEEAAAEKADVEREAAEKEVAEKEAAEKADAEMEAADKADAEKEAAEMADAVKVSAKKAAAEKDATARIVAGVEVYVEGAAEQAERASTSSSGSAGKGSEVQQVPLPLCHYCCHRGSEEHPVHFFTVCICSDDRCTCRCYCDEEQFLLKKQIFPSGLGSKRAVGPEGRALARATALASPWIDSKPCVRSDCCVKCEYDTPCSKR